MPKKCKKCPEREEIVSVEAREVKRFSFPTLGLSVEAKNLEEACKKVKALTEYKNKSVE